MKEKIGAGEEGGEGGEGEETTEEVDEGIGEGGEGEEEGEGEVGGKIEVGQVVVMVRDKMMIMMLMVTLEWRTKDGIYVEFGDTVEPLNKGHFGISNFFPCREVVPSSEGPLSEVPLYKHTYKHSRHI